MGRLIGYQLRPGVAAETWLAFTLETPPVAPAGSSIEPAPSSPGCRRRSRCRSGLKVQSVPGPDEKPQVFETVEAVDEARPAWKRGAPLAERGHAAGERRHLRPPGRRAHRSQGGRRGGAGARELSRRPRGGPGELGLPHPEHGDHRHHARSHAHRVRDAAGLDGCGTDAARLRAAQACRRLRPQRADVASMPAVFKDVYPGGTDNSIDGYVSDWPDFVASEKAPSAAPPGSTWTASSATSQPAAWPSSPRGTTTTRRRCGVHRAVRGACHERGVPRRVRAVGQGDTPRAGGRELPELVLRRPAGDHGLRSHPRNWRWPSTRSTPRCPATSCRSACRPTGSRRAGA